MKRKGLAFSSLSALLQALFKFLYLLLGTNEDLEKVQNTIEFESHGKKNYGLLQTATATTTAVASPIAAAERSAMTQKKQQ